MAVVKSSQKMLCTGGRDVIITADGYTKLDEIRWQYGITDVVVGDCPTGVDKCVREWASSRNLNLHIFIADWDYHGKSAGPKRNVEMARFAGRNAYCCAFKGGRGTYSCRYHAAKKGITIIDLNSPEYCQRVPELLL